MTKNTTKLNPYYVGKLRSEDFWEGVKAGKIEAKRIIIAHLRIIRASQSIRTRARILNIIERIEELKL